MLVKLEGDGPNFEIISHGLWMEGREKICSNQSNNSSFEGLSSILNFKQFKRNVMVKSIKYSLQIFVDIQNHHIVVRRYIHQIYKGRL